MNDKIRIQGARENNLKREFPEKNVGNIPAPSGKSTTSQGAGWEFEKRNFVCISTCGAVGFVV